MEKELINQRKMKLFVAMNPILEVSDEEAADQPKLSNHAKVSNINKKVMNPTKELSKKIDPSKLVAKVSDVVKEPVQEDVKLDTIESIKTDLKQED